MSANNWHECPICEKRKVNKANDLKKLYGKISPEEYEEKRKEIDRKNSDEECEQTVREDGNVYLDDEGNMRVEINMRCEKCKVSWVCDQTLKPN